MEFQQKQPSKTNYQSKWIYLAGYSLLALSLTIYVVSDHFDFRKDGEDFSIFFVHYFLAIAFTAILLFDGALGIVKSWKKEYIGKTVVLLNLYLISAYSLNRVIPVFQDSTDWFCVVILVTSAVMLSYRFYTVLPTWVKAVQGILLGCSMALYLYLASYVANIYAFGAIGMIAFGIGAHAFVPIFLFIATIALIKHNYASNRTLNYWVAIGFAIVLAITVAFIIEWNSRIKAIDRIANQFVLNSDTDLPDWVTVGETVKNDWIGERILKSSLVYTTPNPTFNWDIFPRGATWDERKKHDPLVFIASLFSKCSLSDETRIKILQAITDNRHRAQERLWSGDNLTTSYIVSDIDIYPNLRLAYTEKYLNIKNSSARRGWWGAREEAIYTFQLPEGSVVTSLSLWINGKEEKSILTSKQKATEAYATIVGKEARDPSVLHWQEGNTVSARIFPCTEKEERRFKIGVTSPLPERDGKIIFKNITFKGPNPQGAEETVRVRFIGQPAQLDISSAFKRNKKGDYILEQRYDPNLTITFAAEEIKPNRFSFDGWTYSMALNKSQFQTVHFSKVFLDINNSWNDREIGELRSLLSDKEVYVYAEDEFIKLNDENWSLVTSDLQQRNFSLFPFHQIKDTAHALVISKGNELSPHLKDFSESNFAQKVGGFFASNNRVYLFNLSGGISTFVSSLREFRGLEFAEGNVSYLLNLLHGNQFPSSAESGEKIILHDSQTIIQRTGYDSTIENNAPDHLARLFAYNDIMRKVGSNYFKEDYINDELVDEASTAYVVSPVSSLIVLETKEDYERFGIKDKDNSLHNAAKQSSGAVPEPHEWALIMLFAALVFFALLSRYKP